MDFKISVLSGVDYHCSKIDYFPKEDYSPEVHDSTMAIPCKYFWNYVLIISFSNTNRRIYI